MSNKILKIAIVVALCLIVILTITLFACNDSGNDGGGTTTTTITTNKPEPAPCEKHTDEDGDKKCDVCGADIPNTDKNDSFDDVAGTVYVTSIELNVRTSPERSDDNLYGSVKYGEALNRIGQNESWTKIEIDGKICYVSSDCVSQTKPIDPTTDFTAKNDTVYVISGSLTARSTPFYDESGANIVTSLEKGTALKRTGIAAKADSDGITWSRIEIELQDEDGNKFTQTVYVSSGSNYISTEKEPGSNGDGSVSFSASNDVLTVKSEGDRPLRDSTAFSAENPLEGVVDYAKFGEKLQAIAKGTESDGTVWYKVKYNNNTYYVIYKPEFFDINK